MRKTTELAFTAGVKYEGKLYFSAMYINGFFSYDFSSGETCAIGFFEKEGIVDWLHFKAFLIGSEAWFMPLRANHIACVDLKTMEIKYIDIPNRERYGLDAYVEGVKIGNDLLFAPRYLHSFVRIDTKTKTAIELYHTDMNMDLWSRGLVLDGTILHVTNLDGEIGMDIDVNTGNCKQLIPSVGMGGGYYSSIKVDREAWMIPYGTTELLRVELDSREKRAITTGSGFYRGWSIDSGAVLMPTGNNTSFIRIRKEDDQIIQLKDGGLQTPAGSWGEINVVDTDDDSYLGGSSSGMVVEYLKEEDMIRTFRVVVDEDQYTECIFSKYKDADIFEEAMQNAIREGFGINLTCFLKMIK